MSSPKGTKSYLVWVGPSPREGNRIAVQGYVSVEDLRARAGQPGHVDRGWLDRHPPPKD